MDTKGLDFIWTLKVQINLIIITHFCDNTHKWLHFKWVNDLKEHDLNRLAAHGVSISLAGLPLLRLWSRDLFFGQTCL